MRHGLAPAASTPGIYAAYTPGGVHPLSNLYAVAAHRRWVERPVLHRGRGRFNWETTMLDLLVLAITVGFFAGAIAYVHACDRL